MADWHDDEPVHIDEWRRTVSARLKALGRVVETNNRNDTEIIKRVEAIEKLIEEKTEFLAWAQFIGIRIPGILLSLKLVWRVAVFLVAFFAALGFLNGPIGSVMTKILTG